MYVVIVSGWRWATMQAHGPVIRGYLLPIYHEHGNQVTLRHGQCKYGGVDKIAEVFGLEWGWKIQRRPAKEVNGRVLGGPRNRDMCAQGGNILLAFPGPGSTGTWNCIKWAAQFRIPFEGCGLEALPTAAANR